MKKALIALISLSMFFGVTGAAKATEISGNLPQIWGGEVSTNGQTSVVWWDFWSEETDSAENYVSFNLTGKNSEWSEPVLVEADEILACEVLDSGKVFIVYVSNNQVFYQTTADGNNFSTPTLLPHTEGITFDSYIDVDSLGKAVTIVISDQSENGYDLFSWTSPANFKNWKKELVTDNLYPASKFGDCNVADELCSFRIRNLEFGQNAKGQQAIFARVRLIDDRSEPYSQTWVSWSIQRKSISKAWQKPIFLESFGPENVDSYRLTETSVVVTPKGRVGIAFTTGYNDNPPTFKIFVSNGFNKKFQRMDTGTLSVSAGTHSGRLINVGEVFYAGFNRGLESFDPSGKVFFGEVGKLNKAKQVGTTGSHTLFDLARINGKFSMISEVRTDSIYGAQSRKLNGNKWTSPKNILVNSNGFGHFPWSMECGSASKMTICTVPSLDELFDSEFSNPTGLLAEVIK